jgi:hypothetical protein
MALRLGKPVWRLYGFTLDRLRRSGADGSRALSFGEEPREKALTFSDSLHFYGRGLECLLHSKQSVTSLSWE